MDDEQQALDKLPALEEDDDAQSAVAGGGLQVASLTPDILDDDEEMEGIEESKSGRSGPTETTEISEAPAEQEQQQGSADEISIPDVSVFLHITIRAHAYRTNLY